MKPETRVWVLVPTRDHPQKVAKLYASMVATAVRPELISLVLGYDSEADRGPRFSPAEQPIEVRIHEQPTTGLTAQMRGMARRYPEPRSVVNLSGDDFVFESPGWDETMRDVRLVPRAGLLFFGEDGIQGNRLATHMIFAQETLAAIDYGFGRSWETFNDTWLWCLFHLFDPPQVVWLPRLRLRHDWHGDDPKNMARWTRDKAAMTTPSAWGFATHQLRGLLDLLGLSGIPDRRYVHESGFRMEVRDGEVRTAWDERQLW